MFKTQLGSEAAIGANAKIGAAAFGSGASPEPGPGPGPEPTRQVLFDGEVTLEAQGQDILGSVELLLPMFGMGRIEITINGATDHGVAIDRGSGDVDVTFYNTINAGLSTYSGATMIAFAPGAIEAGTYPMTITQDLPVTGTAFEGDLEFVFEQGQYYSTSTAEFSCDQDLFVMMAGGASLFLTIGSTDYGEKNTIYYKNWNAATLEAADDHYRLKVMNKPDVTGTLHVVLTYKKPAEGGE